MKERIEIIKNWIYYLVSCQGSFPPSWITLDASNGLLNFTTPCLAAQTTYKFWISSQVTGDSLAGLKQICLTVLPFNKCSVNNWDTWVSWDSKKWLMWSSGYAISSDSS